MLVPSLFTDNFVNDFFNGAFDRTPSMFHATGSSLMNADVKEYKEHYELGLELPGYKKEDIVASLKDGYLTIERECGLRPVKDIEKAATFLLQYTPTLVYGLIGCGSICKFCFVLCSDSLDIFGSYYICTCFRFMGNIFLA